MTGLAKAAYKAGLTPNQVSVIGLLFALASSLLYWKWSLHPSFIILAPLLLLLSGFCDALDGALARICGKVTVFGAFLDSMLDRYGEALIFLGIMLGGLCSLYWGIAALIGSILVSYARARAEMEGVKMETVGLAERAERILIIVFSSFLNNFWFGFLNWGVIILAILTNITVLQRVIYFYKMVH